MASRGVDMSLLFPDRRSFLKDACIGSALCSVPARVWSASVCASTPDLRIGLLSDTHISFDRENSDAFFRRALSYFRDRKVDGVLVAGDLTNNGITIEHERVAAAWWDTFPDGRLPDGNPVANLMHYGDHDSEVRFWTEELRSRAKNYCKKIGLPEPDSTAVGENRKIIWERLYHEPWEPIQVKTVKGFTFVLSHFVRETAGWNDGLGEKIAALKLDPKMPFFYSQHRPFAGMKQCCWGGDAGRNGRILAKYPNAVSFTGHTHYMLTDDKTVWQQGGLTLVNTGALLNQSVGRGRENGATLSWVKDDPLYDSQMSCVSCDQAHGGMVLSVFGSTLVFERRDFASGLSLGPDIVIDVLNPSSPKLTPPEFDLNANGCVVSGLGRNRKGCAVDQVTVSFPVINASCGRPRALDYRVCALAENGAIVKEKIVFSSRVNCPPVHDQEAVVCVFAKAELGRGAVRFEVFPRNSYGVEGRKLVIDC